MNFFVKTQVTSNDDN